MYMSDLKDEPDIKINFRTLKISYIQIRQVFWLHTTNSKATFILEHS